MPDVRPGRWSPGLLRLLTIATLSVVVHSLTAAQVEHVSKARRLDIMFSRHLSWLTGHLRAPLPPLRAMVGESILELGAGDGTALIEATAIAEAARPQANGSICAVGLLSLPYNTAAVGPGWVKELRAMRFSTAYPHLAVATGNFSRAALEGVALRSKVHMPVSTPTFADGDFGIGLQFPAHAFDLVFSQTALSKLNFHRWQSDGALQLAAACSDTLRVLNPDGGSAVMTINGGALGYNLTHSVLDTSGSSPSTIFDGEQFLPSTWARNLTTAQQAWLAMQVERTGAMPIELLVGEVAAPNRTAVPDSVKASRFATAENTPRCTHDRASRNSGRSSDARFTSCAAIYVSSTVPWYSPDERVRETERIVLSIHRFLADGSGRCAGEHGVRASHVLKSMAHGEAALPELGKAHSWMHEDEPTRMQRRAELLRYRNRSDVDPVLAELRLWTRSGILRDVAVYRASPAVS
jgi:SAM-dependent methyltransferase